ncbi:hypothetical protein GCM10009861_26280 [Neomicrococcus aestuarii]
MILVHLALLLFRVPLSAKCRNPAFGFWGGGFEYDDAWFRERSRCVSEGFSGV